MTEKKTIGTANTGKERVNTKKQENYDYDSFWKDLVKRFFPSLLKRALPELYKKADIKQEPRFLDKEFRDILNTGNRKIHKNPRTADFLLEVPMKNGSDACILFHIEAEQGSGGGNLAERMNHYRALIYAHHRKEPVALAIIAGSSRKKERFYSHSYFGTEIIYRYNNLVLAELSDRELQASDNPIDLAFYAAKCALKAKEEIQKYKFLRTLTELLAERGWNSDDKRDLVLFIARIINLEDEKYQELYWEFRQQLDKEGKLMYEPFLKKVEERMAEKRGIEKGIEKGKEEMAKELIANGVSPDVIAKSAGLPVERVRALVN